jgi:hypothetical protein
VSDAPLPPPPSEPAPGLYRHYKGNDYEVMSVARHSETEEWFVVYRPLKDLDSVWIRPHGMFLETVDLGEGPVRRFAPLN